MQSKAHSMLEMQDNILVCRSPKDKREFKTLTTTSISVAYKIY